MIGYCDCGDTCCKSCGPAQGHEVRRVRKPGGGWTWVNVDPDDDRDEQPQDEPEGEPYEA